MAGAGTRKIRSGRYRLKAAVFHEHGGPDVIRIEEIPRPEPGPGQVRIRVGASSLNHLDVWVRRGLPFQIPLPHIGGADIAGEVDATGPGAEGVPRGTRVVVDPSLDWAWVEGVRRGADLPNPRFRVTGEHTQGGFAEYAVVPAENLMQLPDHVEFETAAAASLVSVTAWRGLMSRARLRAGERVLITGGSGGVSTVAIQMARNAGAHIFVLTSGEESCRRVRELGADVALDRSSGDPRELIREATGPRGVDVALDSVGEVLMGTLIKALSPGGRLVTYGATTGPDGTVDLRHVFWKQLSILGTTMGSPREFREAMEQVFRGHVEPVIHSRVELEGVAGAQELLDEGGVFGKIVVRPAV